MGADAHFIILLKLYIYNSYLYVWSVSGYKLFHTDVFVNEWDEQVLGKYNIKTDQSKNWKILMQPLPLIMLIINNSTRKMRLR